MKIKFKENINKYTNIYLIVGILICTILILVDIKLAIGIFVLINIIEFMIKIEITKNK